MKDNEVEVSMVFGITVVVLGLLLWTYHLIALFTEME